jgi:hypothetical protein
MTRIRPILLPVAATILGSSLFVGEAPAQWSTDPTVNNAICTTVSRQYPARLVSDGSGGAIITWWELDLTNNNNDIRAQRISAGGVVQWAASGIAVCTDATFQGVPDIASDGAGGAIIAWQDNRNGVPDIYAQRINGSGVAQWTGNGLPVCLATRDQVDPQLTSDGSGGAIIVWRDFRAGPDYVPYAQRLDANGAPQWTGDGILLSATNHAEALQCVNDGNGGAIVAWHQYSAGQFDIYAQRITSSGALLWGTNGLAVCTQSGNQLRPLLAVDAPGGVLIAWEDFRTSSAYSNVYVQRVNAAGTVQWSANGVVAAPNTLDQRDPGVLSDGGGGAFVTWRYGFNEIWAQRLGATGLRQWANDGIGIGQAGDSKAPQIASDGGTGAIIAWYDFRNSGGGNVYAQRVNLAGAVQWTANGVGVCTNMEPQALPRMVVDGWGGAILVWQDGRNNATNDGDLYAQKIDTAGGVGGFVSVDDIPALSMGFTLGQNFPNPCRAATTIEWRMPVKAFASVNIYDLVGRHVSTLVSEEMEPGIHSRQWQASGLPSGIYYYQLRAAGRVVQTRRAVVLK